MNNCVFIVLGEYEEPDFYDKTLQRQDILYATTSRIKCENFLNTFDYVAAGYLRITYRVCDLD